MRYCKKITYEANYSFFRMNQSANFIVERNRIEESDWGNSIYFFLERKLIENYRDVSHCYPIKVQCREPIKVICCKHKCFMYGDYQSYMNDLIYEIQETIIEDPRNQKGNTPFMEWLGLQGFAFQCYNNPDEEMEIAIPHHLFNNMKNWTIQQI